MIYLNYAATSYRRPDCVADAVLAAMQSSGNAGRGNSSLDIDPARTVFEVRNELSRLFGFGHPERVVFSHNATESLNQAILGILEPGDHVIATDWDHNSVLRPLTLLEEQGVYVDYLRSSRDGKLDIDSLPGLIRDNTRLVVCTHASNVTGDIADVGRFSEVAHSHSIPLLVDASQTAGAYDIDMAKMGIDILVFTGHKSLMGPTGTGGMCVGENVDIRPVITGGTGVQSLNPHQPQEYPEHLEAGTLNVHGIAGLKAAVEFISEYGPSRIHEREMELANRFSDALEGVPGVILYGGAADKDAERTAVVSLNIENIGADEVGDVLANRYGISVRTGIHCAPRMHRALGTDKTGTVRFSFGFYTTEEEADAASEAVKEISKIVGNV